MPADMLIEAKRPIRIRIASIRIACPPSPENTAEGTLRLAVVPGIPGAGAAAGSRRGNPGDHRFNLRGGWIRGGGGWVIRRLVGNMPKDGTRRKMKLLFAADRKAWRAWLRAHYKIEEETWLVYYKKNSGKPRIDYNDAVEEALCFGWIDSTVRALDAEKYAQRFSPRNPKTPYSQANRERMRALIACGKVVSAVAKVFLARDQGPFTIPADILRDLKAKPKAWMNFRKFSPAYVRIRIAFIEGARARPAEFEKRKRYFISMTEKNRLFGFGGVEKYF